MCAGAGRETDSLGRRRESVEAGGNQAESAMADTKESGGERVRRVGGERGKETRGRRLGKQATCRAVWRAVELWGE